MQSQIHKHTQTDRQTNRQTDKQTDTHTHTCTYKSNLYNPGVGQGMHTLIQNNSNLKVDIIQVSGPIAFTQSHTRTASSWSLQIITAITNNSIDHLMVNMNYNFSD